jgi:hypothetical protein
MTRVVAKQGSFCFLAWCLFSRNIGFRCHFQTLRPFFPLGGKSPPRRQDSSPWEARGKDLREWRSKDMSVEMEDWWVAPQPVSMYARRLDVHSGLILVNPARMEWSKSSWQSEGVMWPWKRSQADFAASEILSGTTQEFWVSVNKVESCSSRRTLDSCVSNRIKQARSVKE